LEKNTQQKFLGGKKTPNTHKKKLSQAEGKQALASPHFYCPVFCKVHRGSRLQKRCSSRRATGVNTVKRPKGSPDCWKKLNQIITRLSSSILSSFLEPQL